MRSARLRKLDLRRKIIIFSKVASLVKEWLLEIFPKDLTEVTSAVADGNCCCLPCVLSELQETIVASWIFSERKEV